MEDENINETTKQKYDRIFIMCFITYSLVIVPLSFFFYYYSITYNLDSSACIIQINICEFNKTGLDFLIYEFSLSLLLFKCCILLFFMYVIFFLVSDKCARTAFVISLASPNLSLVDL